MDISRNSLFYNAEGIEYHYHLGFQLSNITNNIKNTESYENKTTYQFRLRLIDSREPKI